MCDVAHLNKYALGLKWTPDFPKAGVCFADTYQLLNDSLARTTLAHMARDALPIVNGTVVIAVATRGIALATTIADLFGLPMVVVGAGMKSPDGVRFNSDSVYGKKEMIVAPAACLVGDNTFNRPAIIVDDACESGGTFRSVIDAFAAHYPHIKIHACVAPVQIGEPSSATDVAEILWSAFRYDTSGKYLGVGRLYHTVRVFQPSPHNYLTIFSDAADNGRATLPPLHMCSPQLDRLFLGTNCVAVHRGRFPNGDPDIKLPRLDGCKAITYSLYLGSEATGVPDDFATELAILGVLAKYVDELHVDILFFPYGTHERVTRAGVVATAETAAKAIGALADTHGCHVTVTVFDIHALQEQFYFGKINPKLVTVAGGVNRYSDYDGVVFPDDGAAKRFADHVADRAFRVVLSKQRKGDVRKSIIQDVTHTTDPEHAIANAESIAVVDDMMRTGGTIMEALRLLQEQGAKPSSVDVCVTHLDVFGDALARFLAKVPPCFRRICCMRSTPEAMRVLRHPFFASRVENIDPTARYGSFYVFGTTSPNKVAYLNRSAFTVCVPSGVPEQPLDKETIDGARRRAQDARKIGAAVFGDGAIGVGCENGLRKVDGGFSEEAECTFANAYGTDSYCDRVAIPVDEAYTYDPKCTYGAWFAKRAGLPAADSWYAFHGVNRQQIFQDLFTRHSKIQK